MRAMFVLPVLFRLPALFTLSEVKSASDTSKFGDVQNVIGAGDENWQTVRCTGATALGQK